MTTEEKARAYDEALEKARMYRDNAKAVGDYAAVARYENIFPELRESEDEDERIRKGIIEIIKAVSGPDCDVYLDEKKREKYLAYLEKQKEQKHAPDDLQKSFEAGQTSIVDNPEKYGLCKVVEWNDEDEDYMNAIITIINRETALYPKGGATEDLNNDLIAWLKSLRPQPKQEVTDEEIEEMVKKRARSSGTTKSEMAFYRNGIKDAIKRFSLHTKPKQEWSDKDECILKGIIGKIDHDQTYGVSKKDMLSFLEALRPQSKPSWSEEDEKIMQTIIKEGDLKPSEIAWFKSLRPSWKPSEEQMEALEIIVRYGDKESTHIKNLTSLYEQLQKL